MTRIWGVILLLIVSTAGMSTDCRQLSQLDWLLGEWHMDGMSSTVTERWHRVSEASFEGLGSTTSKANPAQTTSESMRLVDMSGELFFLAKVPNNPLPVAFVASGCEPGRVLFSNEGHDFPQYLAYQMAADGTLKVQVSSRSNPGFVLAYRKR